VDGGNKLSIYQKSIVKSILNKQNQHKNSGLITKSIDLNNNNNIPFAKT